MLVQPVPEIQTESEEILYYNVYVDGVLMSVCASLKDAENAELYYKTIQQSKDVEILPITMKERVEGMKDLTDGGE